MTQLALACLGLAAGALTAVSTGAWQPAAAPTAHTVMEIRQYTLRPDQRDVLIDVFERHFIEGQEEYGMRILGTFRDLDNPDRFVWMRSFPDMPTRGAALTGFYSGPIWKTHRGVANATMVDVANVLMLRAARPGSWFASDPPLPPPDARGSGRGIVTASIVYLRQSTSSPFADVFENDLKPQWQRAGASIVAELVTDPSTNNFPSLPNREGENVFVWISRFADQVALDRHHRALAGSAEWRALKGQLSLWTHQPIETLRLQPTARSRLQGS